MAFSVLKPLAGVIPGTRAFHGQSIQRKLSLLFFATTLLALTSLGVYGYYNASMAYHREAENLLKSNNIQLSLKIEDLLQQNSKDLNFISNYYGLLRYAYWSNMHDARKMQEWNNVTIDMLSNLVESRKYYHKIHYVDTHGNEQIVIRVNPATGKASHLAATELYHFDDQTYLDHADGLKRGEHFVSTIMLSEEKGKIEQPHTAIFRLFTPLIGDNGVRYGTIVIDIRAEAIYKLIAESSQQESRELVLIDGEGDFLYHPNKDWMFAHQLGHGNNLQRHYPSLLAKVTDSESIMLEERELFISSEVIHAGVRQQDHVWMLVGMVPTSVALKKLNDFLFVFFMLFLLVLGILFASSRYMISQLMTPLTAVTRQLQRLGRGEAVPEEVYYPADDEIRRMLESTDRVVKNMQLLASQADAIASGDLSGEVQELSGHDLLGHALNNMTAQLLENRQLTQQRNWLKDGVAEIAQKLTGEHTPQQLATQAITLVGRYLEAGCAVLYIRNESADQLELLGSYMHTERQVVGGVVKFGEGAVGQVAREHKPIVLRLDKHSTETVSPITTGTMQRLPVCTYTWPLLREDTLLGVLEVASLEVLDQLHREYLDHACETIAAFLYTALQKERIQALLTIAEESTRQEQQRSKQLQAVNAQMEEQQQQLQQQTEELQQTNAQMEEQQQQLQQQTEELQQTNAQMEEQQQQLEQQTESLQKANSEMELQSAELGLRNTALEKASRYKSDFLANMSHELRTPLNSIILLSRMFTLNESKHLDEEELRRATVIYRAGHDLLTLINDILDLSKIESGKMEVNPQRIDPVVLTTLLQSQFEDTARHKGVAFELHNTLTASFVSDPDKLQQILRNLLSNAFKFTAKGSVVVTLAASDHVDMPVLISVSDTGIGIPKESQQNIFNAFQQVDGSISRQFGGTGLGLSISLRLAQLLGGRLAVKSVPEQGSTFELLLPRTLASETSRSEEGDSTASMTERSLEPIAPAVIPHDTSDDRNQLGSGDAVMLVIDDDEDFCREIARINRKNSYKTLITANGEDGLILAEKYQPQGILLDLGLPDMDGVEVLKRLKGDHNLRHIPVYVISARDRNPRLMDEGILGYLQKPVEEQQILDAESKILHHLDATGNMLMIESSNLQADRVRAMVTQQKLELFRVADFTAALAFCQKTPCSLLLFDLAAFSSFDAAIKGCRTMHEKFPQLRLLIYSESGISDEQDALLRAHTDSIIIQSEQANKRMLENIERFVCSTPHHRIKEALPSGAVRQHRLKGRNILVVDDDARNLFVITSALEQQGAVVFNALNGFKALELLEKQQIELIFMDIMMPEMSGYETITAVRAVEHLHDIPIVALTAKALKNDQKDAMKAGANDYLAKPVDYEVLINMAAAWCEKKA